ncbi:MAG: hypothetical protein R3C60_04765 [Parvularculaceae bacterium]
MLRNHVTSNIGSVGFFVNSFVTISALVMIAGAYFSAVSQIVA